MMYNREDLLKDLRSEVVEVTFNKVSDGSERVMRCTLKPEMLPPSYLNEQQMEKDYHQRNPDVIAAWDVQKGGWRSFRIDTVTYAQAVDGY